MGQAVSFILPKEDKSKPPPFTYNVPPPKPRDLDPVQSASYVVHANDLVQMRASQRLLGPWSSSVEAARSSPLVALLVGTVKTAQGILFSLCANPSMPFTDPIGWIYGITFYTFIFIGLAIFQFILVMFNIFGGQSIVSALSVILTKKHLSFVNWGAPEMFEEKDSVSRGKELLGSPITVLGDSVLAGMDPDMDDAKARAIEQISNIRQKCFDVDVARTLLLFSASVYEREEAWVQRAADYRPWAEKLLEKSEERILDFADDWKVKFTSISDLVSVGGTYAGAYYSDDGPSPWICVVFKGTGPTNYSEWLIDATCAQESASDYLWGSCHQGFYTSLFPANGAAVPVLPYRRIMDTVEAISTYLLSKPKNKGKTTNLWVTGHSLGAALATLFYTRTLKSPPKNVLLRDAYVYGCPAVGGAEFLSGFEELMHHPENDNRTVWRVTNNKDVVASVPPGVAGPRQNRLSVKPSSLLNYGSMGIELHMQPNNAQSPFYSVTQQAQPGTKVVIVEDFAHEKFGDGKFFGNKMKPYHPLAILDWTASTFCPWLADHAPPSYWNSLSQVTGEVSRPPHDHGERQEGKKKVAGPSGSSGQRP